MTTDIPSISTFSDQGISGPFDPAQNPSKAAAFWLRRDIVRGVFEPHERLKVEHLVQFYGVGHSPIREAILLMSESGLVIHEHQKGYRVAPVSLDDYDDVRAVYQRLYKLAIEMAIDLADDAWEESVVVQLHRASKAKVAQPGGDPQSREQWQRTYWEFHGTLLAGCRSPLLMQMLGDIGFRLERYVNLFASPSESRASADEDVLGKHRAIVDALVARDKPRALALIDEYFAANEPVRNSIIEKLKLEGGKKRRRRAAD
ncbi:GntR family carbon starvation induced transcriptional regulator [Sphingopyxis panaciterrae]|uniref:GntR family transcriptional regulator n=1 Tax=Sphingopyxis panaciterrae TaxID=363841 RepID=UPI0014239805|nr:GntR family carbon starvation induced transcriptional regulator [Sphingopyxis panaciterrae]